MNNHIILNATGTTSRAKAAYRGLERRIAVRFPDWRLHLSFSSPVALRHAAASGAGRPASITELIDTIALDGPGAVVVQSLHVLPGHEFHRLVRETRQAPLPAAIGMPLLHSPVDYARVCTCLLPLVDRRRDQAVVVLGHGTDHPCWTGFQALAAEFENHLETKVYVATLEKYPGGAEAVIEAISAAGCRRVRLIPLLIVAGMHFFRDIIGDRPDSWQNRLRQRGIELDVHDQGLAALDTIADIFADHIEAARASATECRDAP